MRKLITAIVLASLLLPAASIAMFGRRRRARRRRRAGSRRPRSGPVTLPQGHRLGDRTTTSRRSARTKAIRGGTLNFCIGSYPLTFRLMGPNYNDSFACGTGCSRMTFGLVAHAPGDRQVHPDDGDTLVGAGRPEDYLFQARSGCPLQRRQAGHRGRLCLHLGDDASKHIVDPFYNTYAEQYFESVDKIDDHTLRIVGKRPSWRPLVRLRGLWPDSFARDHARRRPG